VHGAVLVAQGQCSFATKAWHAQSAGASQVVIQALGAQLFSPSCMENDPAFRQFEMTLDGINVSLVVVSHRDGEALRDAASKGELLTSRVQAAMESPPFLSFPTTMLLCMAVGTLLAAAKWALQDARAAHDLALRQQMADDEEEEDEDGAAAHDPAAADAQAGGGHQYDTQPQPMSQMMQSLLTASTFVVTASGVLLVLYLFPEALTHVFDVMFFLGGVAGTHQVVEPALAALVTEAQFFALCMGANPMERASRQYPFWRVLRLALSAVPPFVWIACKEATWIWALHDLLSMLLIIFVLRFIRLPNIKIAAVLGVSALAYDVFWVLIQPRLTHSRSVMVAVAVAHTGADGQAPLPMVLKVPTWESVTNPEQFEPNMSILGYGDLLIPGLLLVFLRQFDKLTVNRKLWNGYHAWAITGYGLGLLASFIALYFEVSGCSVFAHAQEGRGDAWKIPCRVRGQLRRQPRDSQSREAPPWERP
jgi:hypothetical protein